MRFVVVGSIENIRTLSSGASVRIRRHLNERFAIGRWRKMAGEATIRSEDGALSRVELHWFEAHGVGKVYMKIKRRLGS